MGTCAAVLHLRSDFCKGFCASWLRAFRSSICVDCPDDGPRVAETYLVRKETWKRCFGQEL
jgi:hypothetical protein